MTDPSFDELIKIVTRPVEPRPGLAARLAAGAMQRRERARRAAIGRRALAVTVAVAAALLVLALAERQPGEASAPPGRLALTPRVARPAPVAAGGGEADPAQLAEALAATEAQMRRLARLLDEAAAEAERLRRQLEAQRPVVPRRERIENRCDRTDPLCPLPLDERPEQLTRNDIRRGMRRVHRAITRCGWSVVERTKVVVHLDIPPNGVPRILDVSGGDRDLRRCVAVAVGAARFPASQVGMDLRYPLWIPPAL